MGKLSPSKIRDFFGKIGRVSNLQNLLKEVQRCSEEEMLSTWQMQFPYQEQCIAAFRIENGHV